MKAVTLTEKATSLNPPTPPTAPTSYRDSNFRDHSIMSSIRVPEMLAVRSLGWRSVNVSCNGRRSAEYGVVRKLLSRI